MVTLTLSLPVFSMVKLKGLPSSVSLVSPGAMSLNWMEAGVTDISTRAKEVAGRKVTVKATAASTPPALLDATDAAKPATR